ncbi:MAG: hypothetical protein ACLRL4_10745 [Bifidobacterium bifidum]
MNTMLEQLCAYVSGVSGLVPPHTLGRPVVVGQAAGTARPAACHGRQAASPMFAESAAETIVSPGFQPDHTALERVNDMLKAMIDRGQASKALAFGWIAFVAWLDGDRDQARIAVNLSGDSMPAVLACFCLSAGLAPAGGQAGAVNPLIDGRSLFA